MSHGKESEELLQVEQKLFSFKNFLYTYGPYLGIYFLALIIRLIQLGRPSRLMFDEVHYVPDAVAILKYGHEVRWFDSEPKEIPELFSIFQTLQPHALDYQSSHPPLGKTLIGLGIIPFDYLEPFGWRLSSALAGALISILVVVLAKQIFANNKLAYTAGLFSALSNFNIAMSNIALLDIFLALFVLIAIIFTVQYLKKIPDKMNFFNPNLIAAAVFFGLAGGVKWSAVYYVFIFALLILTVEFVKYLQPLNSLKDKMLTGVKIMSKNIIVALTVGVAYAATWVQHFYAYRLETEGTYVTAFNKIVEWHVFILTALAGVTSPHNNASSAQEWLWVARPNRFAFLDRTQGGTEIVSTLPNLVLMILAFVGIIAVTVYALRNKHLTAFILPLAVTAGWVPWLFFQDRTIFFFYIIVFEPYLIIAAAWLVFQFRQRIIRIAVIGLMIATSLFMLPISNGTPVTESSPAYNLQGNWWKMMIETGLYNTDRLTDEYYDALYSSGVITEPRETTSVAE